MKIARVASLCAALAVVASLPARGPAAPNATATDSLAQIRAESALDSLAATERAFAALSVEEGMKVAFLQNLGRDGLVFRRGLVNGRKSWEARGNPAGTLDWAPAFAEVSGNADLGWTTGPWEYRPAGGGEAAYGTFLTVWARPIEWARPEERIWQVAIDMGISHPKGATGVKDAQLERGPLHKPVPLSRAPGVGFGVGAFHHGLGVGVGSARSAGDMRWAEMRHAVNDLLATDRSYAFDLRGKGAAAAIGKYAAEDLRLYREGAEPAFGKTPAIVAIADGPRDREWTPLGSRVSTSYDLGCSWGLARTRAATPDTSAYLHVWRRDARGQWVLVADVENRFPR